MRLGARLPVIALTLWLIGVVAGCGGKFEQTFEVAYLSYGEPGVPYGALVVAAYSPDSNWMERYRVELARQATLLFPPPYHVDGGVPHLSISSGFTDKNSALWVATGGDLEGERFEASVLQRCVLLWGSNPSADAAVVLYANQTAVSIRASRYGREIASLTSDACSVAVVRYTAPAEFDVIGSATYARPAWFDDERIGYISRSDYLIARGSDSTVADTLASGVESFSTAPGAGIYAVCYKGDSIAVYNRAGESAGPVIQHGSVPVLSSNGRWLAYHAADHGLWALDLESGAEHELGVGYPVNWAPGRDLLLFFERRVNDKNEAETVFHVCEPISAQVITLSAQGHLADAILLK